MKNYAMADVMSAAVQAYIAKNNLHVTEEQRREIERRCCVEILMNHPEFRALEVRR